MDTRAATSRRHVLLSASARGNARHGGQFPSRHRPAGRRFRLAASPAQFRSVPLPDRRLYRTSTAMGKWRPECSATFPEGVAYGPQSSEGRSVTAVLQFGGASGNGYLSPREVAAGTEELKKFGTFEGGIFRRNDDGEGRRNTDAYQAIWEHVHGRRMDYPKPRYRDPIMVDPQNYDWLPVADMPSVSEKPLGAFTERQCAAQLDNDCARRHLSRRRPQHLFGADGRRHRARRAVSPADCSPSYARGNRRAGGARRNRASSLGVAGSCRTGDSPGACQSR